MKFSQIVLTVVISLVISAAATTMRSNTYPPLQQVSHESVYDRVLRTGTIRCGFFEEAPFTIIDPNTGKKSGIAVELAEKIASELGLKIEWESAANFGTITEDLRNGRFDAVCGSVFNLPRAGRIDYTIPYTYVPVYAFTQDGRGEFDGKLDQLDWSKISVAGLDGEGATTVARKKIPDAKFMVLPQNAQIADMLTSVADKKADIAFVMPTVFKNFDATNPNRLKRIAGADPFYIFNVSFGLKPDEAAFKNMLDIEIRNQSTNGFLKDLFKKYDPDGLLFHPADLYKVANP